MTESGTYPLSQPLARILYAKSNGPNDLVPWNQLRLEVAAVFGNHEDAILRLIPKRDLTLRNGTFMLHLTKIIKHDSAVRDVLTTGHLAKLLGRYDYLKPPWNYVLLGFLNPLFDRNSQLERAIYFQRNSSFSVSSIALESQEARQMIEYEKAILKNFDLES